MSAILHHIILGLRLNLRNRMAMIYGYLFPLIFLIAFWMIYRADRVPLSLHMGELLTVTVLGGACFGLPTTMVSERERGVWRRYRLAPVPRWTFVASTLVTRYVLLITAALIQLGLALAIGMPAPAHPLGLIVAFTCAAVAFLGLGLVIAMLADSVPAVQALGQCIFLPMLMIGGIAVRLSSLPAWAQHLSAFFPGRYAVEAMQACVTGGGLGGVGFALAALLAIGLAGAAAAAMMFRWDTRQTGGRAWLLLALGGWLAVGLCAEWSGRAVIAADAPSPAPVAEEHAVPALYAGPPAAPPAPAPAEPAGKAPAAAETPARPSPPLSVATAQPAPPPSWRDVTDRDFQNVAYARLPSDQGIVAPIATVNEAPDPMVADQLDQIRAALGNWAPGKVADPVQRARNLLYVAAVPDVLQMEQLERFLPVLVYERLRADIPREDLPKILYWIAMHPNEGEDAASRQLASLGLPDSTAPATTVRTRVMLYAFKLLGRLTGAIVQK